MSAAPLLRVIDGGLSVTEEAPPLPRPHDGDRLYPALKSGGGGAFVHVAAVSLILHGALIAASVAWNPFGEERAAGGLEELIVIEGVDVTLLDQMENAPSPLAEAQEIEAADAAEPVTETEVASAVEPASGRSPLPGEAIPVGSDSPMEVAAEAAEMGGEAAAAPSETAAAAEPDWTAAEALEEIPPAAAPAMPVEAEEEDAALAATDESASEPSAEPETAAAEATIVPVPPDAVTAEIVPEDSIKPVEDTVAAEGSEILPEAPVEEKAVEVPKTKPPAKKKSVASLPTPSTPSSEANPTARGPTKGKAGAGGKDPKAQGKASLSSYQSKLVAHLRRYRTYPAAARSKRLQGTALVSFTINSGGRVVGVSLAKGTGHPILDHEAVAMVRRASPFPAIPPNMGKSQVTVRAPIRFDMR
jgi:protein TonB